MRKRHWCCRHGTPGAVAFGGRRPSCAPEAFAVVLVATAGRLPNHEPLMQSWQRYGRVLAGQLDRRSAETPPLARATTGQKGCVRRRRSLAAVAINGIVLIEGSTAARRAAIALSIGAASSAFRSS